MEADSALAAYLGLTAWPDLMHDRPAVLYPQPPSRHGLTVLGGDGWADQQQPDGWDRPRPGWAAVLEPARQQLTVTRPGGLPWFTGPLPVTRQWRRAARNRQAVLQITGPFAHPGQFPAAAAAGLLQLVVVPLSFAGSDTW